MGSTGSGPARMSTANRVVLPDPCRRGDHVRMDRDRSVRVLAEGDTDSVQAIERVLAAARPELVITSVVAAGPPASALLNDVGPDDLVVVGASSHEGAAAFWLGSTPRHLVRHSPCPVAVIRGPASRGRPLRVVVGVDGSRSSDRAVEWAADEADRLHVDLVVVHAWWYMYVTTDNSPARDLTRIDGACVLERSVELARERCGVEVTGELVEFSPVPGILQSVTDGDLLVLGSRGRGAVISGLFGSTVNSVLEQAVVPVVVVPLPAEHD